MSRARRRQGEGSVSYIERTGRWRASFELPPAPDGTRRRWERTAKTRTEVVKLMTAELARVNAGGTTLTSTPLLDDWLDYWFDRVLKVKPRTRDTYRSSLRYIRASLGRKKLGSLTVDDIRDFHDDMLSGRLSRLQPNGDQKPLSSTTAHHAHGVLSTALKAAVREQRATTNIAELVSPPPRAAVQVKILDHDEVGQLIQTVQHDRLGSRWAAALLTGARQGELLGLEWDRVDFERNSIDLSWQLQRITFRHGCPPLDDGSPSCLYERGYNCPQKTIDAPADWVNRKLDGGLYLARPKSRAGWRQVPLVGNLRRILWQRWLESRDEPNPHNLVWTADPKREPISGVVLELDGAPIDPSADSRAWHDALERAGVRQVRLHDARHTAVTRLYDNDVPEAIIQQIVGQSTIATTRGYRATFLHQMVSAMTSLDEMADTQLAIESDTP